MKAIMLSALTLMCSATLVGELPQQTVTNTSPDIEKQAALAPVNFCGQPQMLRWFFNSEIGRQMQLRQQAAIAQAVAEHEAAAPK